MRAPPRRAGAPLLLLLVAVAAASLVAVPPCLAHSNAVEAAAAPPATAGRLAESLSAHTPTPHPPRTVDEATHMHCGEVLRVLESKWLPAARTDPVTQERVLHVAFLGDSLACFQFDNTVRNVETCVQGRWGANVSKDYTRVFPSPRLARAVLTVPSTFDAGRTAGGVTRIVLSFVRCLYSMDAAFFLQEHYAKGRDAGSQVNASEEGQKLQGSGWPSWPSGPSPHILYIIVGAWDSHFPRRPLHGYDHRFDNVFGQQKNITWPERLVKMDRLFDTHFTQPMRRLLRSWDGTITTAATSAGRRRSFYFSPPDQFFLMSTPLVNCRAECFHGGGNRWVKHQYRYFNGFMRCSTLAMPAAAIVQNHFHAATLPSSSRGAAAVPSHDTQQQHHHQTATGTRLVLLDGNDFRDACTLDDGVHFTRDSPRCWERLLLGFWGLF